MNIVDYAYLYAKRAHEGQVRKYNLRPYIEHPIRIAERMMSFTESEDVIAACYLHDVIEDTNVIHRDLCRDFNARVADLVMEVTNESKQFKQLNRAERKRIDREHIAKASYEGKVIKILDRIDNLNDLYGTEPNFERLYAEESKLLLGVLTECPSFLRNEMEDLIGRILT